MKQTLFQTGAIIVVIVGLFFWFVQLSEKRHTERVQEINNIRKELLRADSVRAVYQKQVLDSIRSSIKDDTQQKAQLKAINTKLNQLNEKTNSIYSAIRVDMPEL